MHAYRSAYTVGQKLCTQIDIQTDGQFQADDFTGYFKVDVLLIYLKLNSYYNYIGKLSLLFLFSDILFNVLLICGELKSYYA